LDEKGRVILPEAEDWTGFAYAINAMPLLVKYVLNSLENPYVIGPDQSIKNAIETACPEIKVKYAEKHRDRNESLEVESKIELPDMKGYDAVLFDDTIQAGTTMYNVVEEVKKRNPKSITCAAVHGEFVFNKKLGKSAYDLLKEAGADIVVTNTIRTPVSKVDVVPLLVKKLCSAKLLK
jgi:ribose-phosphate pyrophosphokinase